MRTRRMFFIIATTLFFLAILITSCSSQHNEPDGVMTNWENVKMLPFSGYICGFQNTSTFLQIPLFLPQNDNIDKSSISAVSLLGQEKELICTDYQLSMFRDSSATGYKLTTFSFKAHLPEAGMHHVDRLSIRFNDNTTKEWELGNIEIIVENEELSIDSDILSMREFIVNQTQSYSFKIAYANTSNSDIMIEDFSYPESLYENVHIMKYKDFSLQEAEEGLGIPANSERTFLITFTQKEVLSRSNNQFYFMLPFVFYSANGVRYHQPAQTQATIVQTPVTKEYIVDLMYG